MRTGRTPRAVARFRQPCRGCGDQVEPGQRIAARGRAWVHLNCDQSPVHQSRKRAVEQRSDSLYAFPAKRMGLCQWCSHPLALGQVMVRDRLGQYSHDGCVPVVS